MPHFWVPLASWTPRPFEGGHLASVRVSFDHRSLDERGRSQFQEKLRLHARETPAPLRETRSRSLSACRPLPCRIGDVLHNRRGDFDVRLLPPAVIPRRAACATSRSSVMRLRACLRRGTQCHALWIAACAPLRRKGRVDQRVGTWYGRIALSDRSSRSIFSILPSWCDESTTTSAPFLASRWFVSSAPLLHAMWTSLMVGVLGRLALFVVIVARKQRSLCLKPHSAQARHLSS